MADTHHDRRIFHAFPMKPWMVLVRTILFTFLSSPNDSTSPTFPLLSCRDASFLKFSLRRVLLLDEPLLGQRAGEKFLIFIMNWHCSILTIRWDEPMVAVACWPGVWGTVWLSVFWPELSVVHSGVSARRFPHDRNRHYARWIVTEGNAFLPFKNRA